MLINLPNFSQIKIIVVGDVMLDRYWSGATERISPEAPVPVVHVQEEKYQAGGAANVALNLAALGVQVELIGLVGDDKNGRLLEMTLAAAQVQCHFVKIVNHPTITKLRVLGGHQQLLRLDFEKKFQPSAEAQLIAKLKDRVCDAQAIILSDYAKGTLSCAPALIALSRANNIPVIVDPKTLSFKPYAGASVLTPNLKEMYQVVGECVNDTVLIAKARSELINNDLEALLITRSERGMLLVPRKGDVVDIPTKAQSVFDVTGAGDTVVAVLAAAMGANVALEESARLANIAAGISVSKLGAATVSLSELHRGLRKTAGAETGIVTLEELKLLLEDCRARHQKIVFTNGCFDMLHSGHIQYLEEAKQLGAKLVIAVNDDDSVRRLKGETRPINSLTERMSILSGLRCVDWVIPFAEDTPLNLIKALKPDVLVKGGDYQISEIAGSDWMLAHGGAVKILNFKPGFSTSRVIKKILAICE